LLGQRVEDLQAGFEVLFRRKDVDSSQIHLHAIGRAGPAGIHFAALNSRVTGLHIKTSMTSWVKDALQNPMTANMLEQTVPGALQHYDLSDLLKSIAPRPVFIE
jgi:hypothetical protein